MEVMTTGKFPHLQVMEDGQLVGIVSIGDVVKPRPGNPTRIRYFARFISAPSRASSLCLSSDSC